MIDFNLLHPSDQLMMIMERIYECGMTTTSGGNLSVKDDNGDIWITPAGIDKGSLTGKDMVCVKPDGTVAGMHKPSSELPFHRKVYEKRPDLRAVLHAHPPALTAFSAVRKIPDTGIITSARRICGEPGMAPYDVPGSVRLGERIAAVFEQGCNAVMLENHGVVVGAENIHKAFLVFETLDFCARTEINAFRIGKPIIQEEKEFEKNTGDCRPDIKEFVPQTHSSEEKTARRNMCEFIHRAYKQRLFTGAQGTISRRLGEDSFLISPQLTDRKYTDLSDLVLIEKGMRETGKTPDPLAPFHKLVYETHPRINAIITAQPPNIMAFAAAGAPFNSRIIPESYILLRNMPRLPLSTAFLSLQDTARIFTRENPVVIVENDCVIVSGSSLLNAFDLLEVAEYSAKAIINAGELGDMVLINDVQLAEIHEVFHLN
jgi:L-fuculose-phosphate aldolase